MPSGLWHMAGTPTPVERRRAIEASWFAGASRRDDHDPGRELGRGIFRATTMAIGLGALGTGFKTYGQVQKGLGEAAQVDRLGGAKAR